MYLCVYFVCVQFVIISRGFTFFAGEIYYGLIMKMFSQAFMHIHASSLTL